MYTRVALLKRTRDFRQHWLMKLLQWSDFQKNKKNKNKQTNKKQTNKKYKRQKQKQKQQQKTTTTKN